MKIIILIVVAIAIFLVSSSLFLLSVDYLFSKMDIHIANDRIVPVVTNSLAVLIAVVWSIWFYNRKRIPVIAYELNDLKKVSSELDEGIRDDALWLQATIDADKTGRSTDTIYAEYRLKKVRKEEKDALVTRRGNAAFGLFVVSVLCFVVGSIVGDGISGWFYIPGICLLGVSAYYGGRWLFRY